MALGLAFHASRATEDMKLDEARTCQRCDLAHTRTQVVIGTGPQPARLIIVGEAPGKSEDEGGAPFIGRSGKLLFDLLTQELDLVRDECFVTNVVKCRPPNNRTPRRSEVVACAPWLELQKRDWSGGVVVALGLTSARVLTGLRASMAELHGRPVSVSNFTVVPTYHPAAALRQGPSVVSVMRQDFQIVRGLLP